MINEEELQFIETYLLRSGEHIEVPSVTEEASFIDLIVIKQTERTRRKTGIITIAVNFHAEEPGIEEEELLKRKPAPRTKFKLEDHDKRTIRWFGQGWIIKEIRFKKDGMTPDSHCYRIGYRLYQYQKNQQRKKEEELEQAYTTWKNLIKQIVQVEPSYFSEHRSKGITKILKSISSLTTQNGAELKVSSYFPSSWPLAKKLKFLHFIAAFLPFCLEKEEFDWKEIGAGYYREIGGSKEFDAYKNEFIEQLEEWAECPVTFLGMTSFGKITPLYFSGQLSGMFSSYQYGPVHALTDLAVLEDDYRTMALNLWLVENRAILTRMAAKKNFLQESKSFILCTDGHLRSAHKNCMKQLLTNSGIEQVIIWTDYDLAGYHIAKELYLAVSKTFSGKMKWISPEQEVIADWKDYEVHLEQFLQHCEMEQEEILGGEEEWNKWINH